MDVPFAIKSQKKFANEKGYTFASFFDEIKKISFNDAFCSIAQLNGRQVILIDNEKRVPEDHKLSGAQAYDRVFIDVNEDSVRVALTSNGFAEKSEILYTEVFLAVEGFLKTGFYENKNLIGSGTDRQYYRVNYRWKTTGSEYIVRNPQEKIIFRAKNGLLKRWFRVYDESGHRKGSIHEPLLFGSFRISIKSMHISGKLRRRFGILRMELTGKIEGKKSYAGGSDHGESFALVRDGIIIGEMDEADGSIIIETKCKDAHETAIVMGIVLLMAKMKKSR